MAMKCAWQFPVKTPADLFWFVSRLYPCQVYLLIVLILYLNSLLLQRMIRTEPYLPVSGIFLSW